MLGQPQSVSLRSATAAGLHNHVGEVLHLRVAAREVEDGEGLHLLWHAAGGDGGIRVQRLVQTQELLVFPERRHS